MKQRASFESYLVGLYLFSVPVFSFSGEMGLSFVPQILGAVITLFAIFEIAKVKKLPKNIAIFLYLLFTAWSLTSSVFAEYQTETTELFTLIKVSIITFSVSILIRDQSDFYVSLSVFFASVFITVVLNFQNITAISNLDEITDRDRFAGTFANANTAALYYLGIIWTGSILLFRRNINFFLNILIVSGILLAGVVIIYSGSRKGLLGLGFFSIGLAYFLIKEYAYTTLRKLFILIVVIGTIFTIFFIIYSSPFYYRVQTMLQGESSFEERIYLFSRAIYTWCSSFRNLVMGVGVDNFQFYNDLKVYSHSTVSETLACTGIVGFGLYFAVLFSIISTYFKASRIYFSNTISTIIFVLIFLALLLFFNMTAVMISDRLFWPLLGAISSYGLIINKQVQDNLVENGCN